MADEQPLVWDYKNGFIVNSETGEVVDQIYVLSETSGFSVRGADKYFEFSHFYPLLGKPVQLSRGLRRVYGKARGFIESLGARVDPLLLIRIILAAHEHSRYVNDLLPAVAHIYLKMCGKFIDVSEICKQFNIDDGTCGRAGNIVFKLSAIYKSDRKSTVAQLISKYSSPLAASVAMVLLPRAKIGGISSKCAAASLVWLASQAVGEEASQKSVANFYGVHPSRIPAGVRKIFNNVNIEKSRAGVVTRIVLPRRLCEEISKIAELSAKVACAG